jgi:hypothetical protein
MYVDFSLIVFLHYASFFFLFVYTQYHVQKGRDTITCIRLTSNVVSMHGYIVRKHAYVSDYVMN